MLQVRRFIETPSCNCWLSTLDLQGRAASLRAVSNPCLECHELSGARETSDGVKLGLSCVELGH